MAFHNEMKQMGALFALDLEDTISSKCLICPDGLDSKSQWEKVKNIEPRGSADEWKKIFEKLDADGHQIAIVTFNKSKELVHRYLQEKIGLSNELLGKIFLNCWLPEDESIGKNQHIAQAIEHFKRDKTNTNIILVEDRFEHLEIAKHAGLLHKDGAVLAPKNQEDRNPLDLKSYISTPHLEKIRDLSNQLKKEISASNKLSDFAIHRTWHSNRKEAAPTPPLASISDKPVYRPQ